MNYRNLGRTQISVSELCLGTLNFGWTIDRGTAFSLLDAYRDSGGCFLQSIHINAMLAFVPEPMKAPEEWVGDWLRARAVPRGNMVLSTRLNLGGNKHSGPMRLADVIRNCCEKSLQRFGVSYLDLLVLEWTRELLPIEDVLMALDMLIEAGLVRHVGVANTPLWRLMEAISRSAARKIRRFEALQTDYSILTTPFVHEQTRDLCQTYNIGLLATSALGGRPMNLRRRYGSGNSNQDYGHRRLSSIRNAAMFQNATNEQAALAWVLSHQHVSSVIISPRSLEQLKELVEASFLLSLALGGDKEEATGCRNETRC